MLLFSEDLEQTLPPILDSKPSRAASLWIEVDQQYTLATGPESRGKVDGGRGLAGAALLIGDGDCVHATEALQNDDYITTSASKETNTINYSISSIIKRPSPDAVGGISPYLGAGLGPAFVKVYELHFSTDYEDTSGNAQAYDPPLSFYNSRQDADLCDMVLAGHLYAGADYGLNAKTLLGLKLTYSMLGDIEASGGYSLHPFHERDPDFPNHNTFTGPRYWTLALTVKFLVGNLNCST